MGRRSEATTAELTAVSNTYVAATNSMDLGVAKNHRLQIMITGSAQRVFMVPSKIALSDAEAVAALGAAATRITLFAVDVTVGIPEYTEIELPFPARFVYFIAASSAVSVNVIGDAV